MGALETVKAVLLPLLSCAAACQRCLYPPLNLTTKKARRKRLSIP